MSEVAFCKQIVATMDALPESQVKKIGSEHFQAWKAVSLAALDWYAASDLFTYRALAAIAKLARAVGLTPPPEWE